MLARKLSTSVPTVLLWRKRFESDGIAGILEDRPRSGRPKRISVDREAGIVEATMKTTPKDAVENMTVIDAIYRAAGLPVREPS